MKILVTGATGMVGKELVSSFINNGHQVSRILRKGVPASSDIVWDFTFPVPNTQQFDGFDAVVHLAGESIAEGRWNEAKKKRIRDSRVIATSNLCRILASVPHPPKLFISASAIGYYGNRGAEVLTEASGPGNEFLSDVCVEWENAALAIKNKGARVVHLRFGVILSGKGGALKKMLPPFKAGVGGKLGSGDQYMSWVALPEIVMIVNFVLTNEKVEGPVNVVAPEVVTNSQYTKALGRALKRPTLFPMPAFAARLAFGEMADALLLSSTRVDPKRLRDEGYSFRWPGIDAALKDVLTSK